MSKCEEMDGMRMVVCSFVLLSVAVPVNRDRCKIERESQGNEDEERSRQTSVVNVNGILYNGRQLRG